MTQEKHPFDVAAERLETLADKPVANQLASADYWELRFASDDTVGDYPQAVLPEDFCWGPIEVFGPDGFPTVPVPQQQLQRAAKWTDVLSSNFPPRDNSLGWSEGYMLNQKALAVLKQCRLGEHREYPAVVRDQQGHDHSLTYLHIGNVISPTAIDFGRSEFYIAEILGIPKGPVTIDSYDEWVEKQSKASAGELDGCERFSSIAYKRLLFRKGHAPNVDLFSLERLSSTTYISAILRKAIVDAGLTGLEIKPNQRLFKYE